MSLQKQLEHIADEIDGAKHKLEKLRDIVATANLEAIESGEPITYAQMGKERDLLRHAGGSLNHAIRIIAGIMANGGK